MSQSISAYNIRLTLSYKYYIWQMLVILEETEIPDEYFITSPIFWSCKILLSSSQPLEGSSLSLLCVITVIFLPLFYISKLSLGKSLKLILYYYSSCARTKREYRFKRKRKWMFMCLCLTMPVSQWHNVQESSQISIWWISILRSLS